MVTKIRIANGKDKVILPITPESFEVTDSWSNEELNINQIGLITMIGKRGLRSITISSFFPNHGYDFLVPGGTAPHTTVAASSIVKGGKPQKTVTVTYHPWDLVKKLQSWRGKVLTLFITKTDKRVSWPCVIDGDFTYGERDASGDVYYTLTLKEYKRTNAKRTVVTPARRNPERPFKVPIIFPYKTRKGDTLNKVSKGYCGSTRIAKVLYKQNKKAVKKGFKKYKKTLSAAAKKKYKKLSKYNKQLPKGVKLKYKK